MIHVLRYNEELESVDLTSEQAKKSVQLWVDLMDKNFATKSQLSEYHLNYKNEFKETKSDIRALRSELESEIRELRIEIAKLQAFKLEWSITLKLGFVILISTTIASIILILK